MLHSHTRRRYDTSTTHQPSDDRNWRAPQRRQQMNKTYTIEEIVRSHQEREYAERGDRFATEAEMSMIRADPMGFVSQNEIIEITTTFIKERYFWNLVRITVDEYEVGS